MGYRAYELSHSSIILLVNHHALCLTFMFSQFAVMALPPPAEEGCRTGYFSVSEAMFTLESLLLQILSHATADFDMGSEKKTNFAA